jgi:hypothetical protein
MQQIISLMCESEYVCAIETFETDFYDYNLLLDKLYKEFIKPGVKKWQVFSCNKPDENKKLSLVFCSRVLDDAVILFYPIEKTTTNREKMLHSKLVMLDAPGQKDFKQVELFTKFRKYVPEEWQDKTCPPPDDAVLAKFKIEKSERMRSNFEKRKEQQQQRLESVAKRAEASACAVFLATPLAVPQVDNDDTRSITLTNNNESNNDNICNTSVADVFEA